MTDALMRCGSTWIGLEKTLKLAEVGFHHLAMIRLIRCYTCNLTFDIDKKEKEIEAKEHSRSCHEMSLGFRA